MLGNYIYHKIDDFIYHVYIFYPFFTHSLLKIVKKVDVVESTECFYSYIITTTDDLGSSSIDDFHFGTSEIQILLRFMKYISSNSALVLSVALLVSVAHRKEENTGLVN